MPTQDPNSIVDYLNSKGVAPTKETAAGLYEKQGLGKASDYLALGANNASANTALLKSLTASKVPAPTVITSGPANDKVNDIGNTINGFETPVNGPKPPTELEKNQNDLKGVTDLATTAYDNYKTQLSNIDKGNLSPSEQAQIDAAQKIFDSTKALQEKNNAAFTAGTTVAGIRSGRNRYATEIEQGNIKASIDEGIAKIADLDAKSQQAILTMKQAMADKDYEHATKVYDAYSNLLKDKRQNILDIANLARQDQQLEISKYNAYNTETMKNYGFAKSQGFKGSLLDYKAAESAATKASNNPTTLTKEDAARYGLPDSIVGKSDYSLIQDLSVSNPPQWFKEANPEGANDPELMKTVWNNWRNSSDLKVFTHLLDINKAQSGQLQEGTGLVLTPQMLNTAFNGQ